MTDLSVEPLEVGPGMAVTLHFSLELEDGSVVDSNFDSRPASFVFGDGSFLPGFEAVLKGMLSGDQSEFLIKPEQGFGQHNPSNIQRISRQQFDDSVEIERGLVLSFQDAGKTELPGVVVDYDAEDVVVDFNHPLAGRVILFRVHVLDVVPAVTH